MGLPFEKLTIYATPAEIQDAIRAVIEPDLLTALDHGEQRYRTGGLPPQYQFTIVTGREPGASIEFNVKAVSVYESCVKAQPLHFRYITGFENDWKRVVGELVRRGYDRPERNLVDALSLVVMGTHALRFKQWLTHSGLPEAIPEASYCIDLGAAELRLPSIMNVSSELGWPDTGHEGWQNFRQIQILDIGHELIEVKVRCLPECVDRVSPLLDIIRSRYEVHVVGGILVEDKREHTVEVVDEADEPIINDLPPLGGKYGTDRDLTVDDVRRIVARCIAFQERGGKVTEFYRLLQLDPFGSGFFTLETLRGWLYNPKFRPKT